MKMEMGDAAFCTDSSTLFRVMVSDTTPPYLYNSYKGYSNHSHGYAARRLVWICSVTDEADLGSCRPDLSQNVCWNKCSGVGVVECQVHCYPGRIDLTAD